MGVKEILPVEELDFMVEQAKEHGAHISYKASGDGSERPYEINSTWFSALNRMDEELELQTKRYAASRSITQLYRPLLSKLGLTYPQYLVMLVIWEEDGISVKEIGDRLLLDSGTLTPLLKRMQSAGLLERVRSKEDERKVTIKLTADGRALKDEAAKVPEALLCAQTLPIEKLQQVKELVDELRESLVQAE